jgi:hypothetical protein
VALRADLGPENESENENEGAAVDSFLLKRFRMIKVLSYSSKTKESFLTHVSRQRHKVATFLIRLFCGGPRITFRSVCQSPQLVEVSKAISGEHEYESCDLRSSPMRL